MDRPVRELNLELGRPDAAEAIRRLAAEVEAARKMGTPAMKLIHGYGSSGKGGRLRTACRTWLRQQELYCGGVSVSLRNAQFRTVSRQMRLPAPTHLMKDIWQSATELTRRLWKAPEPVRMLTVTALYITDSADSFQQLDLLETPAVSRQQEKQEKLERAMDAIRGKYGRGSISFGLPGEERAGWDD